MSASDVLEETSTARPLALTRVGVGSWGVKEVVEAVATATGTTSYTQVLEANDVDGEVLVALSNEDLLELGVASLGHRKKILTLIAQYTAPPVPQSANTSPSPAGGSPRGPPPPDYENATDGTRVVHDDPYLAPYAQVLRDRFSSFSWWKTEIERHEGSLSQFALGHTKYGFHRVDGGVLYQDWAPNAHALSLAGEFNNWQWDSHPCERREHGKWVCFLKDNDDGTPLLKHGSKIKVCVTGPNGRALHLSPYARYVEQDSGNPVYDGVYWESKPFAWQHPRPPKPDRLRIYEAHVGMASEERKIASYREFADNVIPYVAECGYNAIQLMAVMEHSYYASFGYQVTSFFAPSSRFGPPQDLQYLIDVAHSFGITVLLDVVHSHASKNVQDGLNQWDESNTGYFHGGEKGTHAVWDSRLFDYSQWEVLRFLLSNLRYWIDEFHFDGFRFDGVTAMLLVNRAVGDLPSDYDGYFGAAIDVDALRYLTLANEMLHELYPFIITIAEDACGFPTLCRPVSEGGVGFDHRLGMGLPDFWKETLKVKDEDWDMGKLTFELANRRWKESTIGYVESHDQALVGDKTLAFWLMDKEMYTNMSILQPASPITDRGLQLHKLIRLITCALGGEGYLTFMGNEFGHPEWIDFPREGNNYSFDHCRRQWSLAQDHLLRYQHLVNFDKAMMKAEIETKWLTLGHFVSLKHQGDKVIVFEKGPLLFAFNFHHSKSFVDYRVPVQLKGSYKVLLHTDHISMGGHDRLADAVTYSTEEEPHQGRPHSMMLYLPCRCALVLQLLEEESSVDKSEVQEVKVDVQKPVVVEKKEKKVVNVQKTKQ